MEKKLNKAEVQAWIRGQKEAERIMWREKVKWLQSLTPEESLRIYLELKEAEGPPSYPPEEISPVLLAMRRMLDRYAELQEQKRRKSEDESDQSNS